MQFPSGLFGNTIHAISMSEAFGELDNSMACKASGMIVCLVAQVVLVPFKLHARDK